MLLDSEEGTLQRGEKEHEGKPSQEKTKVKGKIRSNSILTICLLTCINNTCKTTYTCIHMLVPWTVVLVP